MRYTASPQKGIPGHCYQAQIFKDGKAFLAIEPTEDENEATKYAENLAEFLNKSVSSLPKQTEEPKTLHQWIVWLNRRISLSRIDDDYIKFALKEYSSTVIAPIKEELESWKKENFENVNEASVTIVELTKDRDNLKKYVAELESALRKIIVRSEDSDIKSILYAIEDAEEILKENENEEA